MLNHVQLRDFKPDVVICPNCTQHLMGVRDVQWAADRMSFTYGCAGCGHEIERPVAEDLLPPAAAAEEAVEASASADADVTVMEEHPFPFRQWRESRPSVFAANQISEVESKTEAPVEAPADDVINGKIAGSETVDTETADAETTDTETTGNEIADIDVTANNVAYGDAPAFFTSLLLLPPKPRLDTPVLTRRFSVEERAPLTPKQVFDTERRNSEQHERQLSDASTATRASVLLRDVAIFNL